MRLTRALNESASSKLQGYYVHLDDRPSELDGRTKQFAPHEQTLNAALLETFCAADHGTVTHYAFRDDGRAEARIQSNVNTALVAWGLSIQQQGIMTFVRNLTTALNGRCADPEELHETLKEGGLACFRRMTNRPSAQEAAAYEAVFHADDVAHNNGSELAGAYGRGRAARMLLEGGRKSRNFWPQGSLVRGLSPLEASLCCALWSIRNMLVSQLNRSRVG
jgi:hypothetical protein